MAKSATNKTSNALSNESSYLEDKPPHFSKTEKCKVVIDWECVNSECRVIGSRHKSLTNDDEVPVKTASKYVISFYGQSSSGNCVSANKVKNYTKKRKVCLTCENRAIEAQDKMLENLISKNPIMADKVFPIPKEIFEVPDSDEDPISDTSSESEIELEFENINGNTVDRVSNLDIMLEKSVSTIMNKFNIEGQIQDSIKILNDRLNDLQPDYDANNKAFENIEKEVDRIREEFYKPFRPTPKFLEPLDLNKVEMEDDRRSDLARQPNFRERGSVNMLVDGSSITGKLDRPDLKVNEGVYAISGNILNVWRYANVVEIITGLEAKYKLRFDTIRQGKCISSYIKTLSCKQIAYDYPSPVRLPVGTRIIGIYNDNRQPEHNRPTEDYYSGIIAEPPKTMNKQRYLVFFDDGYASYISHKDIRLVCKQTERNETSSGVWDDIHQNSRDFIKKYIMQYPERPMVRLIQGQMVRTEWEGSWWYTRVESVDASLVQLIFHVNGRKETIYRGSTRLEPLYLEMQQQKKRAEEIILSKNASFKDNDGNHQPDVNRFMPRNRIEGFKKNRPYVEYTRQVDPPDSIRQEEHPVRRAVAKKSTTSKSSPIDLSYEPSFEKPSWDKKGTIYTTELDKVEGVPFIQHQCGVICLADPRYQYNETKMLGTNPLLIPIVLGWKRQVCRFQNYGKRSIFYLSPCGRRCRNMDEVHRYLQITKSKLEMDFFEFDWAVRIFKEFKPEREFYRIQDISYGKENFAVSCVNSLDKNYPEYVEYSKVRLPKLDVEINTGKEFLVCCDCEDDCKDKSKCACWQLTIQQTTAAPRMKGKPDNSIGYNYRRLIDNVPTGIYECNTGCKCKSTCLNRVAQNPMRVRLQVFKTERRGWGMRTLNDIPAGGFICIYVGNLYSNDQANRQGQDFGDEYFAELDMIEVVEMRKEGYESDVDEDEIERMDVNEEPEDTEDESSIKDDEEYNIPLYARGKHGDGTFKDRPRRELYGADTNKTVEKESMTEKVKLTPTRKFFGSKEDVFIMDAKSIGNIGRYLNHSCNPNVFVQNCFVDTHDLRFPWVAFFSSVHIPAGHELCWDYQYVVGQVDGKEIYCQCASENCRGRLL